jgi:recombinational DNA repair ATPase RecF
MGKTNLIEAIYILSLTKSFRDGNDKVLIKDDKILAKIYSKPFNILSEKPQVCRNCCANLER